MKALGLALLLAAACAPSLPAGYLRARDAAERAYSSGEHRRAAELWLEAADSAGSKRDREEARYRAAASYERADEREKARALYRALVAGGGERAARADFALAELEIRTGNAELGYAELEAAVRAFPSSGVAATALNRYLLHVRDGGGPEAVIAYVARAEPALDKSERAEQLLYARARALDELARDEEALASYLTLAERFPYPYGAYWDDALFHGAACAERSGRPAQALELLGRMLKERETAHLNGSYERPRYADAAFQIATLYRDRLHDRAAASRAFRRVYDEFPSSTLRDDALWNVAALAHDAGDSAQSCAALAELLRALPDSRYAPCVTRLCPTLSGPAGRECHGYLLRALESER